MTASIILPPANTAAWGAMDAPPVATAAPVEDSPLIALAIPA